MFTASSVHQDDVEPAAEFAADLTFAADLLEATLGVQRDRRVVTADDARDHRVEAVISGEPEQVAEQELADAPAAVVALHVHGVLDGRRIGRPGPKGRQRREAVDLVAIVDRDDRGVPARVLRDPLRLVLDCPGHEIEGHGGLGDFEVVDRACRFGVARLGNSGPHRGPR